MIADIQKNNNTKSDIKKEHNNQFFIKHRWWIDALIFIGGTLLLGGIASLLGGKMNGFEGYQMPPATAPQKLFPIAWGVIYIAIGISTFLMWRDKEIKEKDRKINLIFYFIHMFFNVLWPLFFFRLDFPIFSVIWLILTIASVCLVMYRYFYCNIVSGLIFNIYTLWLIYALYLNLGLVLINF